MKPRTFARLAVVALAALAVVAPAKAANVDFDNGGVGNDWNTPDNWDNNAVPTAVDNVFIGLNLNLGSQTIAITANPLNPINELGLGRAEAGATMTINHSAGTLTTNSWTNVGQGTGDHGVYNLSGGSLVKNGGNLNIIAGFDTAIGEVHVSGTGIWQINSGDTRVAGELTNQADTVGIVTVADSGQFNVVNLSIGEGGTGSFTVSDAASFSTGALFVGVGGSASGTVTYGSSATSTIGGLVYIGGVNNLDGMGVMDVNSGLITVGGNINVGRDNLLKSPSLNIAGTGTVQNLGGADVVIGFAGNGTVNVSASGTLITDWLIVGELASSAGAKLSASDSATVTTNRLTLGLNGSSNGQIEIVGANADVTTNLLDVLTAGSNTMSWIADALGVSAIDVNGGVALNNAMLAVDLSAYTGGAGVLTLIDNDLADAVSGMFAGLGEGDAVTGTGYNGSVNITYVNGGNDVALVLGVEVPAPAALPVGLAMLGLAAARRRRR